MVIGDTGRLALGIDEGKDFARDVVVVLGLQPAAVERVCLLSGEKITLLTLVSFATSYFFSAPGAVLGARSFLKVTPSFITKTTFSIALIF